MLFLWGLILTVSLGAQCEDETTLSVGSRESIKFLSDDLSHFSHKFYVEVAKKEAGNFAFSPLSLHSALSLLLFATSPDSQTQAELLKLLGRFTFEKQKDDLVSAYRDVLDSYKRNSTLTVGNRIWVNSQFNILDKYKSRVLKMGTEVSNLDFGEEDVKEEINSWVANLTSNRIMQLVKEFDPNTQVLIANAMSMEEKWKTPFTKFTSEFVLADGSIVDIDALEREDAGFEYGRFRFGSSQDMYEVLTIPYKSPGLEMSIILPSQKHGGQGLQRLEEQLGLELERKVYSSTRQQDNGGEPYLNLFNTAKAAAEPLTEPIDVRIPSFKFETTVDVRDILKELGVKTVFSDQSELGRLSDQKNIKVGKVVHKAKVAVDEEGTEAAAATLINIVTYSARFTQLEFLADRPFLFSINDKVNDIPIMMGRVLNPSV